MSTVHSFVDLAKNSEEFQIKIPTRDNRVERIAGNYEDRQSQILDHARRARIIIHADILRLIDDFLDVKRNYGSLIEKSLYTGMNSETFIQRLFLKRPLTFFKASDHTLLRNGTEITNGKDWLLVGTPKENAFQLKDYLSYDEMQISALIGASTPTFFINNGSRNNCAEKSTRADFQKYGIMVALVGARFKKKGKMEHQHLIITKDCTPENGFGKKGAINEGKHFLSKEKVHNSKLLQVWAKFYGSGDSANHYFPSFHEVLSEVSNGSQLFAKIPPSPSFKNEAYLNVQMFKKRMTILAETFLLEANERGVEENKKVFVQVVGFGLGIWSIHPKQGYWLVEAFTEAIKTRQLDLISTVYFTWFPDDAAKAVNGAKSVFSGSGNEIKIEFGKRNTSDPLLNDDLLVTSFAWDSNSFPGNEFWLGKLKSSSDSAGASCCTIPQLLNPYINPFHANIKVLRSANDKKSGDFGSK